jgi:predicted permease
MDQLYPLIRAVIIFFLLVILIQILKRRGVFTTDHLPIFGKLITELVLPIAIFSTLSVSHLEPRLLYAGMIYLTVSLVTCGIAFLACRYFRFSNAVTGSIVILSGFGSTATIAYPLIAQTYGVGSEAMTNAMIIGEFGSALPFFTIGVLLVSYFGQKEEGNAASAAFASLKSFVRTPIFISLIAGIAVSLIPPASALMTSPLVTTFFDYFNNGFEMIVAITIGLMLRPVNVREISRYLAIALPLSLLFMPLAIFTIATFTGVSAMTREILVIEAAVPSGAIAAVIAERYGCDGPLASTIVVVSFLCSLVTLPVLSILLL